MAGQFAASQFANTQFAVEIVYPSSGGGWTKERKRSALDSRKSTRVLEYESEQAEIMRIRRKKERIRRQRIQAFLLTM